MWSILIVIGGITYGSQYMQPYFFSSQIECEQVAALLVAGAPFLPDDVTYNVRCEPFMGPMTGGK